MSKFIYLKQFKPEELLVNEEEARVILKFIFKSADHELIDSLPMTDNLRGFSQALLLEAIDASYSVGYIKGLFESTANPTKGAMKIIKSFGKKAAKHWFKHATTSDLQNVKVYEFVIDHIARYFRTVLRDYLVSNNPSKRLGAFVTYNIPTVGHIKRLG